MSVQRYEDYHTGWDECGCQVRPAADGNWVSYEDYAALEAKLAEIRALPGYSEQTPFNRNVVPVKGNEAPRWLELAAVRRILDREG